MTPSYSSCLTVHLFWNRPNYSTNIYHLPGLFKVNWRHHPLLEVFSPLPFYGTNTNSGRLYPSGQEGERRTGCASPLFRGSPISHSRGSSPRPLNRSRPPNSLPSRPSATWRGSRGCTTRNRQKGGWTGHHMNLSSLLPQASLIVTFSMTSPWAMASTTSFPFTTFPKTVWRPLR